jgi:hypothetical protein
MAFLLVLCTTKRRIAFCMNISYLFTLCCSFSSQVATIDTTAYQYNDSIQPSLARGLKITRIESECTDKYRSLQKDLHIDLRGVQKQDTSEQQPYLLREGEKHHSQEFLWKLLLVRAIQNSHWTTCSCSTIPSFPRKYTAISYPHRIRSLTGAMRG